MVIVERRASCGLPGTRAGVCMRAPSRLSISVASLIASSRKGRRPRSRDSPASDWTSATSTRHPYGLGRRTTSAHPAGWVAGAGGADHYGTEVAGFAQDDSGVEVELSDGRPLRTRYCRVRRRRSLVRKIAGIGFPGGIRRRAPDRRGRDGRRAPNWRPPHPSLQPWARSSTRSKTAGGLQARRDRRGHARSSRRSVRASPPARSPRGPHRRVRDRLRMHDHLHLRFTDTTRQAATYRGRVLLAGDAAHVHLTCRWTGPQHRWRDAVNSAAGPGGGPDVAGDPADTTGRAPPGRCSCCATPWRSRAHAPRRSHRGRARHPRPSC